MDINNFVFSKSSVEVLRFCYKRFELEYTKKVVTDKEKLKYGRELHNYLYLVNTKQICFDKIKYKYRKNIVNYINFLNKYKLDLPFISEYEFKPVNINGLNFFGKVDAVYTKDVKAIVVDYKSSIKSKNFDNFELLLYSYLFESEFKYYSVVKYGYYFVAEDIFVYRDFNGYDLLYKYIDEIKMLLELKNNVAKKCLICPIVKFCDVKKV